jgi:hypothetical protein
MNSELTHSEIILRIEELSNFENIYDPTQLESNMEEINDLVKILIQNN